MNNFMKDRYGADELSLAVGSVGVVLALVGSIFSLRTVSLIALVLLVLDLLRCFSKNFEARRRENESYRALVARIPVIGDKLAGRGGAWSGAAGAARPGARSASRAGATNDFKRQARTAKKMWKERKTKAFLKCPQCGTMLSVPRGKGKIIVTCPKCHARMETKS